VRRYMGGIREHPVGEAYVETAFRVILFTDLEGSTSLTQQLGDAGAMAVLRGLFSDSGSVAVVDDRVARAGTVAGGVHRSQHDLHRPDIAAVGDRAD
jgi:hypothetical protein